MIPAKEFEGELWIKASDYQKAIQEVKREWVGLTDEERDELARTLVKGNKSVNWLARAIEAKLKEKNHG